MRISPRYLVLLALSLAGPTGAGCGGGNINSGSGGTDASTGDLPNDVGEGEGFTVGSGPIMPPGVWSKSYGDEADQHALAVAVNEAGEVAGGGPLTATVGHPSSFVVKLDPSGKHLWSKALGGDDDVVINGVAAGPAGKVAVTGSYVGTADFGGGPVTSNGTGDAFVEVMSAAGDHVWESAFGGLKFQRANGVAFGLNGDVAISGVFDETAHLHALLPQDFEILGSQTMFGPSMAYAITFDAAGTPLVGWEIDSGGPVECAGVGVDGKLGMVLAGSSKQTLGLQLGPLVTAGGWDMFVARTQP